MSARARRPAQRACIHHAPLSRTAQTHLRASRTSPVRPADLRSVLQNSRARWSSSPTSPGSSPTSHFYKSFARPIAKSLTLAVFTYQVVYWTWKKLEQDEIKSEREAEIIALEAQINGLKDAESVR